MTVTGMTGVKYQLDSKMLSDGGEGEIYRVLGGTGKKVAKLYKAGVPSRELEEKLKVMVKRPPSSKVMSQVAWPLDVIYDTGNKFCGFIMPELNINAELGDIYKYPLQMDISASQKIIIAENICAVISEVHKAGYVFGDFNPRNIGVDKNSGTVAFLDTDTYHVVDSGQAYRCNVCAPGYSAPELLEKCAAHTTANPKDKDHAYAKTPLQTFTKETDNFALAIHIFKLLMNGYTPYGGIKDTEAFSQASPGTGDAAVRRDNYCFKPGMKAQSPAIIPLDSFPQEISDLFTRAFIIGKVDPKQRPTSIEWHSALANYEKVLTTCTKNPLHQYDKKNRTCPLCEADERYEISVSPQITQKQYSPAQPTVRPPVQPGHQSASISGGYKSASQPGTGVGKIGNWWKPLLGIAAGILVISLIVSALNGNKKAPVSPPYSPSSPAIASSSATPDKNESAKNDMVTPVSSTPDIKYTDISLLKEIDGIISSEGQAKDYAFTAKLDGVYRFEFSDIPSGVYHSMYLLNSGMEELFKSTNIGNGKGITKQLKAGETYYIRVKQSSKMGSYKLLIGHPIAVADVSGSTEIPGEITFTNQTNDYTFTPKLDGLYRFEFSDIPSGVYHSIYIFNSGMELLSSETGIGNGKGITRRIDAGETYYIRVQQSSKMGSYKLLIGHQTADTDVTGLLSFSGEITFTHQENNYAFAPSADGTYRFEFSNIPSGAYHSIYIFNSGMELLGSETGIGNGKGINRQLKAGETYYIRIKQSSKFGTYVVGITQR